MKWTTVLIVLTATFVASFQNGAAHKIDWNKIKFRNVFPQQLLGTGKLGPPTDQDSSTRIIGGEEALRGKFPYQVAVTSNMGFCGGCLISNFFVLTAAHCTDGATNVKVYLGARDLSSENEGRLEVSVPDHLIEVHPSWNPRDLSNDIALVQFEGRVQFTDLYRAIALPSRSDAAMNLAEHYVIASGWGKDANNAAAISNVLRYAELRVQQPSICEHFFSSLIRSSNICTDTGTGRGTCNGDSGGPLVYTKEDDTQILIGLTSFGSSIACVAGWPSVFTRVGSYLNWIRDNSDVVIRD